jgi:glyoxylase-like metal-dependent hydrolase (beta-lactamase superfamily II)
VTPTARSAARTPADIRPARAPDEEAKERAVKCVVTLLLVLATSIPAAAADDGSPEVKVTRLGETLYELTTDQGAYTTNSLVSVGDDGLLIVDTQSRKDGVAFRKAIEAFGKGSPSIIVNTHRHSEHVGGNELFGEAPIVIAHALVRGKLRSGSYLFDEFPDSALPDISFTDSLSVYFNGEEIRLIAMPGSHDDNEIIVHFTKSTVVHLSSLANGFNFPSVDADGDVLRFEELVSKAIELLPPDVVIVSGHNRNGTIEDLRAYREMLAATAGIVRDSLAAGKDTDLLAIGDKLLARELFEPAVRFLEASLAEYQDSIYSYYANYELAVAHDRLGHHEEAIRYCRTAAEQNPDSARIAAFLEELTDRPSPAS